MNRVKELRERKGMSRRELAERAKISASYVRKLESNDPSDPTLNVAEWLAFALQTEVRTLFPIKANP